MCPVPKVSECLFSVSRGYSKYLLCVVHTSIMLRLIEHLRADYCHHHGGITAVPLMRHHCGRLCTRKINSKKARTVHLHLNQRLTSWRSSLPALVGGFGSSYQTLRKAKEVAVKCDAPGGYCSAVLGQA